jgi:hypothetical protein
VCNKSKNDLAKKQKIKKTLKKGRKNKKRPKVNLILSHVNHTFFILDPQIGAQAFAHVTHCILRIKK